MPRLLMMDTADQIIGRLGLKPHPEGGHYRETWAVPGASRALATGIYFLLRQGERSHWHRVDADELWLFHAGAPLELKIAESAEGPARTQVLGPDPLAGQAPQLLVPKGQWQAAETTADYTLVSCVVSPGFMFSGFELADEGFDIPAA